MDVSRVSTGVRGLDTLIGGGFREGSTFLITGAPGSGKSIFCLQFLLAGLKKGERGVYVTIDERPGEVLEQATALGWNLSKYIANKELLILDLAPYIAARIGGGAGKEVDVQEFTVDLANYAKKLRAKRLAIDPVGPVILLRATTARIQDQVRSLVHMLQNQLQTTNLLTCYPVPRVGEKGEHGAEEYVVGGVIFLQLAQINGRIARTLSIPKMRSTPLDLTEVPFRIVNGKGIIVEEALQDKRAAAPSNTQRIRELFDAEMAALQAQLKEEVFQLKQTAIKELEESFNSKICDLQPRLTEKQTL